MKFSGRFDAPGMLTLHFPPWCNGTDLISTVDQMSPCINLIISKLGLPRDNPTEHISWTERFYLKTSVREFRPINKDRPYEVAYNESIVNLNAQLNRRIDQTSRHFVRTIFGKQNILDDISRAQADKSWKLFSLKFDDMVLLYKQPFHGAIHLPSGRTNLYIYHPESFLRGGLNDIMRSFSDMSMNLYATLLNIKTVNHNFFSRFSTTNLTNKSLWTAEAGSGSGVVKTAKMMRWVEKNHDHRFSLGQLNGVLLDYALKEGLTLDDTAEDSPIRQIIQHFSRKGVATMRAQGFPNLANGRSTLQALDFPNAKTSVDVRRQSGFPELRRGTETQRLGGYQALARGRETQRKSGHEKLVTASHESRRKNQHEKMQADIEATTKRKLAEDSTFVPPPQKKILPAQQHVPTRKEQPTIPCTFPGCKLKSMTDEALAKHITIFHTGWTPERQFKCPHPPCNKHFPSNGRANGHFKASHSKPEACPECSREFQPSKMPQHRRICHGVE